MEKDEKKSKFGKDVQHASKQSSGGHVEGDTRLAPRMTAFERLLWTLAVDTRS